MRVKLTPPQAIEGPAPPRAERVKLVTKYMGVSKTKLLQLFSTKLVKPQIFLKSQNFLLFVEVFPIDEFQDRIIYGLNKLMHGLNKYSTAGLQYILRCFISYNWLIVSLVYFQTLGWCQNMGGGHKKTKKNLKGFEVPKCSK